MKRNGFFSPAKRRKTKKYQDRKVFVLFLTGLFAALVVAVLAQQAGQTKKEVGETPSSPPEYASVLPDGASNTASIELVDASTPTYIAGFVKGAVASLALVVWSKEDGRFDLRSSLALDSGEERLANVGTLAVERLGTGIPTLVLAGGPSLESSGNVMVVVREADALRLGRKLDKDGYERVASFPVGSEGSVTEELAVDDVDSDGVREVISTSRDKGSASVSVFVWANDRLEYDADLSWAMTMDKQLFPEPLSAAH